MFLHTVIDAPTTRIFQSVNVENRARAFISFIISAQRSWKSCWGLAKLHEEVCPNCICSSIPWSSLSMQPNADKTTIDGQLCLSGSSDGSSGIYRIFSLIFSTIVEQSNMFTLSNWTRSNQKWEVVNKFENISLMWLQLNPPNNKKKSILFYFGHLIKF